MANSYNELFGLGTHSADASLEAYWMLQETTGTSAADSSGNSRDLTITGMGTDPTVDTGPTDWLPSAFHFDGANDRLNRASVASGDDHSILMWMRRDANVPTTTLNSGFGLFSEGNGLAQGSSFPFTDNVFYVSVLRGTSAINNSRLTFARGSIPDLSSAWRKVSFRTTPGASGWQMFVDGTQYHSATGLSSLYLSNDVAIGKSAYEGYFDGKLAGISWFSRKLTDAEEIQAFAGPEPINTSIPTLSMTPDSWTGNTGTWNSQSNGTVSCDWELRLVSDDSVIESGTAGSNASIGDAGTYSAPHYLYVRASNDGGFDPDADEVSADSDPAGVTRSATDTLTLSDSTTVSLFGVSSATDTLSITEATTEETTSQPAADTLTLTDTGASSGIFGVSSSDTLAFTETLVGALTFVVGAEDTLSIAEFARVLDKAADTLVVTDSASAQHIMRVAVSEIADLLDADGALREVTVNGVATDELGFQEIQFDPDTLESPLVEAGLRDSATFVYVTSGFTTYESEAADTLSITDSGVFGGVHVASASDTLAVTESVSSVTQNADLCGYDATQAGNYPSVTGQGGFRLQHPSTGTVTDEVVLRNPNLGNRHRVSPHRINRVTRGGDLIIYRDPSWPLVESLLVQFSALTRVKALELQTFIQDHLGEEIKLIDWEDRLWTGVIVVVDDPVVQDRKGDCAYTMSFEFEGVLA